jgi:dephospho-CoA kinase
MLRVGLTGGLGSGKSTVAGYLRGLGANVINADDLARSLMVPGQAVYDEIVHDFGRDVVRSNDGSLNRERLAELAFHGGRLQQLNAIVHPAVIAAQRQWMEEVFERDSAAVAIVESALIFESERDALARGESAEAIANLRRLDRIVLITAETELRVARYAIRVSPTVAGRKAAEADARARMVYQIPDSEKIKRADYVIENNGRLDDLYIQITDLWRRLKGESNFSAEEES